VRPHIAAFLFFAFTCGTSLAQERALDAPTSETPVGVDKSSYSLLNPAPDDKLREFSTDRPGKSHSSTTVDAGRVQIESDFLNYTLDPANSIHPRAQFLTVGTPTFRIGITNDIELQLGTALYNYSRVGTGPSALVGRGFGDSTIGTKINLFGNDGGDQSLAILPSIKLPTAARNLGNGHVETAVNVSYTMALSKPWSLTLEPNVGLLRNDANTGYRANYGFIANLNREVFVKGLTAAAEIAVDVSSERAHTRVSFDPSLQYLITKSFQLDVGIYLGLTRYSPKYNPYAGVSYRF
jgi:hypothetical protein